MSTYRQHDYVPQAFVELKDIADDPEQGVMDRA
jgi:hypothetical protein